MKKPIRPGRTPFPLGKRAGGLGPLTNFGQDVVERWFTEKDVHEMVEFTRRLVI